MVPGVRVPDSVKLRIQSRPRVLVMPEMGQIVAAVEATTRSFHVIKQ